MWGPLEVPQKWLSITTYFGGYLVFKLELTYITLFSLNTKSQNIMFRKSVHGEDIFRQNLPVVPPFVLLVIYLLSLVIAFSSPTMPDIYILFEYLLISSESIIFVSSAIFRLPSSTLLLNRSIISSLSSL